MDIIGLIVNNIAFYIWIMDIIGLIVNNIAFYIWSLKSKLAPHALEAVIRVRIIL